MFILAFLSKTAVERLNKKVLSVGLPGRENQVLPSWHVPTDQDPWKKTGPLSTHILSRLQ